MDRHREARGAISAVFEDSEQGGGLRVAQAHRKGRIW